MAAHPLNREMGLAGVGGAQDGGDRGTGELDHGQPYVGEDGAGSKGIRRFHPMQRTRRAIDTVRRSGGVHHNVFI